MWHSTTSERSAEKGNSVSQAIQGGGLHSVASVQSGARWQEKAAILGI